MEANLEYKLAIERARDSAVEAMDNGDALRRQPAQREPLPGAPDIAESAELSRARYNSAGPYFAQTDEPQWTGWE